MNLARHHQFALAGALGLSAIALFDAVTHGLTGHWSVFSEEGEIPWIQSAGNVVHGLAYAGALWVLHVERRRIHATRSAAVFGWLLFAAFAALAAGFLLVAPFSPHGRLESLVLVYEPVIGITFGLQFLAAIGLGLSLLKHSETGVGSRILLAVVPVLGVTALLAVVAPAWAHPAYVETTTIIGTALLGTATPPRRQTSDSAPSRLHSGR